MFVGGLIVGFGYGWKMTIVLTSALPCLGGGVILMIWALTTGQTMINSVNSQGGALAEETISNIKTVKALNSETFTHVRYVDIVVQSKSLISKYALLIGFGLSMMFFFLFLDYSLAFYWGSRLVGNQTFNDNTQAPYKMGDVMTIFFAIMIGGFSLGQAGPALKAIT